MMKTFSFKALLLMMMVLDLSGSSPGLAGTITEALKARLARSAASESIPVIISFAEGTDPFISRRRAATSGGMIRDLQASLGRKLEALRRRFGGDWPPAPVELIWINQTVAMKATREVIDRLALDPAILSIESDDPVFTWDRPAGPVSGPSTGAEPGAASALPWNITITGVDSVWDAYGLDGNSVLIGSLDTGIDPGHPALLGKLRPGDAWKDFIFGMADPYDNQAHGTFGSGILVGGTGAAGPVPGIGIAHGSRLIVGKILDAGSSTISQVTTGMQWMLDPDGDPNSDDYPHVVNNSWFSGTRGSTYAYAAAAAWRAAGIIPVFCAGNSGPAAGSTRSPADYKNCISVGGTDELDDRYNSTSVGPSPADTNYFPADGRKPDFSAPGELVYSSQQGGGYGYSSGTSWSAPHVTGTIALMLQANPQLGYDRVQAILRQSSVDLGTPGYDFVYGYGRISAMGAVRGALNARVRLSPDAPIRTTERGGSAFFDVVLEVQPKDSVWISFTSTDTGEGTPSPGLVCFTPVNWELPVRVTVTGTDDDLNDGDAGYEVVVLTSSNDPLYDGLVPPPLAAVNSDDEGAIGVSVSNGWNLVSVPALLASMTRPDVFPTSAPPAYGYAGGYVAADTLRRGVGYWLRFAGAQTFSIPGDSMVAETVAVSRGWNLIGSLSAPFAASGIVSDPPGIATSRFFGFESGYIPADTIEPGRGYWVKAATDGLFILRSGPGAGSSR